MQPFPGETDHYPGTGPRGRWVDGLTGSLLATLHNMREGICADSENATLILMLH